MGLQKRRGRIGLPNCASLFLKTSLLVGGLSVMTTSSFAQEATATRNIIVKSVELTDAPFSAALKMLRSKTGVDVVVIGDIRKFGNVSVSAVNQPIEDVLRLMATSAEADFWSENGVYFFGPKGSAPRTDEPVMTPILTPNVPSSGPVHYEKIFLKYTDPHIMLKRLGLTDEQGDYTDVFYRNVMKTILDQSANKPLIAPSSPIVSMATPNIPYAYLNGGNGATAAPAAPTDSTSRNLPTTGNGGRSQNDQSSNRSVDTSGQEFGRGGQFGGGFGGGGFGGGQGRGGGGAGGLGAGGGQGGAQGGGGGSFNTFLPTGVTGADIRALEADGSLIIRTNDEQALRDLKELIRQIDVKPRQILIKAEFVTVTQSDNSAFGLNWSFQRGNLLGGVSGGYSQTNTAYIQYAAGNVQAQLSWILTTDRGRVVAAPVATTLNNVPVTFVTQEVIPFFQTTVVSSNFGSPITTTQLQLIPLNSGLSILPRINADDTITLFGSVQISTQTGTATGPNGDTFPLTTTQTASVQRIIRNGDSMVIGGFTRKNNSIRSNRVPLLSDLPLLGTLFRSRNVTISDSDLLVFISASIIPERQTSVSLPGAGVTGVSPGGSGGGLSP